MKTGSGIKNTVILLSLSVIFAAMAIYFVLVINGANNEGRQFAANATRLDCLNEVLYGEHVCRSADCFLHNRYFYQACMERADESMGLCDSLPEIRSLLKLEMWKKNQCEALGREDRTCHHIWLKALEVCNK